MFHNTTCDASLLVQMAVFCCSCGRSLTSDEIHFNLSMHKSKNQFICQKCQTRGKEEGELVVEETSEEKLQAYVTSPVALNSPLFSDNDTGSEPDHFYEDIEARYSVDEAIWELSPGDIKKPRKVLVGGSNKYMGKFFLRKKKYLAAHMAAQGFYSEFEILLKDAPSVISVPGKKDPEIERIFAEYNRNMEECFARCRAISREIDEELKGDRK